MMENLVKIIQEIGLSRAYCPFTKIMKFLDVQENKNLWYNFIDWGFGELEIWDVKKEKEILHLYATNNNLSIEVVS